MSNLKKISLFALTTLVLASCGSSPSDQQPKEEKNIQIKEEKKEKNIQTTEGKNQQTQTHNSDDPADINIKKVSQALGNFIGRNLNTPGIHFDLDSIITGIREGATGKPSPMNDQEYEKAMSELQQQALKAISQKNLDEANAFLKENAKAKGVNEIVPGKLQYTILQEGHEPAVQDHGSPQINYVGKYIDGSTFGDSSTSGGPITVPLDQTIPGFNQGIKGMKEGEKRRLFVHPDLGYGTSGLLPPNSLLIFEIEVVKANSPEKAIGEFFQAEETDYDGESELEEMDIKSSE